MTVVDKKPQKTLALTEWVTIGLVAAIVIVYVLVTSYRRRAES